MKSFQYFITNRIKAFSLQMQGRPYFGILHPLYQFAYFVLIQTYARLVLHLYPVSAVYLRGSLATGSAILGASDVDFLFVAQKSAKEDEIARFNRFHAQVCLWLPLFDSRCRLESRKHWIEQLREFDFIRGKLITDQPYFRLVAGDRIQFENEFQVPRDANSDLAAIAALTRNQWNSFSKIEPNLQQTPSYRKELALFEWAKLVLAATRARAVLIQDDSPVPSASDLIRTARKALQTDPNFCRRKLLEAVTATCNQVSFGYRNLVQNEQTVRVRLTLPRPVHSYFSQNFEFVPLTTENLKFESSKPTFGVGDGYLILLNPETAVDEEQVILDPFTDPIFSFFAIANDFSSLNTPTPVEATVPTSQITAFRKKIQNELSTFARDHFENRSLIEAEPLHFWNLFWKASQFRLIIEALGSMENSEVEIPSELDTLIRRLWLTPPSWVESLRDPADPRATRWRTRTIEFLQSPSPDRNRSRILREPPSIQQ